MTKITIAAATKIAKAAHAKFEAQARSYGFTSAAQYARDEMEGSGFEIPFTANADGDDDRTMTNLSKWIRIYAVKAK